MEALAVTIEKTAQVWEQDGVAAGEVREMIGAVDETFLAQMMLVYAKQGLECQRMPDLFHGMHALGKSYALAIVSV